MPRSGIAGPRGNSVFDFLRRLAAVSHRGCTLYVPMGSALGLHLLHLLASAGFPYAAMPGRKWYLAVVLLCVSLGLMLGVSSCACGPSLCVFLGEMSVESSVHFLTRGVMSLLSCRSCGHSGIPPCRARGLWALWDPPVLDTGAVGTLGSPCVGHGSRGHSGPPPSVRHGICRSFLPFCRLSFHFFRLCSSMHKSS